MTDSALAQARPYAAYAFPLKDVSKRCLFRLPGSGVDSAMGLRVRVVSADASVQLLGNDWRGQLLHFVRHVAKYHSPLLDSIRLRLMSKSCDNFRHRFPNLYIPA